MPPGGFVAGPAGPERNYREAASKVVTRGWSVATPELGRWLDRMFDAEWVKEMLALPEQPLGVIEDPRYLKISTLIPTTMHCEPLATLLTARALQLQASGKDREGLEHLVCVLALSRQLRSRAVPIVWMAGLSVERTALEGLERWLEKPGLKPELLRMAQTELNRHESAVPPMTDTVKAEYVMMRNTLSDPEQVLRLMSESPGNRATAAGRWTVLACQAPWERARLERLLNAVCAGYLRAAQTENWIVREIRKNRNPGSNDVGLLWDWLPSDDTPAGEQNRLRLARMLWTSWTRVILVAWNRLQEENANGLARIRGVKTVLALMQYQREQGKPAPDLQALVPRYLPEVPTDPFDGRALRYRVSKGEQVVWYVRDAEPKEIPAGQRIVWSVGPDGKDDGGTSQANDRVFLVPMPAPNRP
jgi:hypothetical protein